MKLIILCLVMCMLSTGCGEMLRRATSIDWDEVRRKNTRIVPGAGASRLVRGRVHTVIRAMRAAVMGMN